MRDRWFDGSRGADAATAAEVTFTVATDGTDRLRCTVVENARFVRSVGRSVGWSRKAHQFTLKVIGNLVEAVRRGRVHSNRAVRESRQHDSRDDD